MLSISELLTPLPSVALQLAFVVASIQFPTPLLSSPTVVNDDVQLMACTARMDVSIVVFKIFAF
jgi:hypothetical protein